MIFDVVAKPFADFCRLGAHLWSTGATRNNGDRASGINLLQIYSDKPHIQIKFGELGALRKDNYESEIDILKN